jgi:hypothetical protein
MTARTLEVVFLTRFSDACARALPAVSALAGRVDLRLTLLRAHDPARGSEAAAREALARFFPEADGFEGTRRVTFAGPASEGLHALHDRRAVDLVLAPGLAAAGVFSVGASPRAALVAASPAPVWTLGARVSVEVLRRAPRRIACLLHPADRPHTYLHRAARLAADAGAELHVLHVVPDYFEGELGTADEPLCEPEVADAGPRRARPRRRARRPRLAGRLVRRAARARPGLRARPPGARPPRRAPRPPARRVHP